MRGGRGILAPTQFATDPAEPRGYLRRSAISQQQEHWERIGIVDISKAVAQTDYIAPSARIAASPPTYIAIASSLLGVEIAVGRKLSKCEDDTDQRPAPRKDSADFHKKYAVHLYRPPVQELGCACKVVA